MEIGSPIDRRLIGNLASYSPAGEVTGIDIQSLARRLILFDQFILNSVRLKEFPELIRRLGFEGTRELLSAGLIEVRCECLQMSQVGQSGLFVTPRLPNLSYRFNWIDAHDKKKYIHDCLQIVHQIPTLSNKQAVKLKRLIANSIVPLPDETKAWLSEGFLSDIDNVSLIKASVALALRKRTGKLGVPFELSMRQLDNDVYKVDTNLGEAAGVDEHEAHKTIEAGLLGVCAVSQAVVEMRAYNAVSGFRNEELPLFSTKLGFLADMANSEKREDRFERVLELADIPSVIEENGGLNIERLIKVRMSAETREFRDWLSSGASIDEKEIRERITGFKAQAGLKVQSATGKAIRFLITNGIGLISSPMATAASIGLSAGDSFLLDKVLPRSGVAAFVSELYPSLFESNHNR